MSNFDPYYNWFAIAPADQPPNLYRLIGLEEFESDPTLIESMVEQRLIFLRQIQTPELVNIAQDLISEVSQAKVLLLDTRRKTEYDRQLYQKALQPKAGFESQTPVQSQIPVTPHPADVSRTISFSTGHLQHTNSGGTADSPGDGGIRVSRPRRTRRKPTSVTSYILAFGIPSVIIAFLAMKLLDQTDDFKKPNWDVPPPAKVLPLPARGDVVVEDFPEEAKTADNTTVELATPEVVEPSNGPPFKIGNLHSPQFRERKWMVGDDVLDARLVRKARGIITLKPQDGSEQTVRITEISATDREYLYLTSQGNEPANDSERSTTILPTFEMDFANNFQLQGTLIDSSQQPESGKLYYTIYASADLEKYGICQQNNIKRSPVKLGLTIPVPASFKNPIENQGPLEIKKVEVRARVFEEKEIGIKYEFLLRYDGKDINPAQFQENIDELEDRLQDEAKQLAISQANFTSARAAFIEAVRELDGAKNSNDGLRLQRAAENWTLAQGVMKKWFNSVNANRYDQLNTNLQQDKNVLDLLPQIRKWNLEVSIYHITDGGGLPVLLARSGINQKSEIPDFPLEPFRGMEFTEYKAGLPKPQKTLQFHRSEVLMLGSTENKLISVSVNGDSYLEEAKLPGSAGNIVDSRFSPIVHSTTQRMFLEVSGEGESSNGHGISAVPIFRDGTRVDGELDVFLKEYNTLAGALVAISPNGNVLLGCNVFPDEGTCEIQTVDLAGESLRKHAKQSFNYVPTKIAVNDESTFCLSDITGGIYLYAKPKDGDGPIEIERLAYSNKLSSLQFLIVNKLLIAEENGFLTLYDLNSNAIQAKIQLNSEMTAAELSPDGKWLLIAKNDGGVLVYDFPGFGEQFELLGHTKGVTDLLFTDVADQLTLYTSSRDATIKVWGFSGVSKSEIATANLIFPAVNWDRDSKLGTIRGHIEQRQYSTLLAQLSSLSSRLSKHEKDPYRRLQLIARLSGEISANFNSILRTIGPNTELYFNGRQINIIEINEDQITIRDRGENIERDRSRLTPGLAVALYETRLLKTPVNAIRLAAYLATCEKLNEATRLKAIALWESEAAAASDGSYSEELMKNFLLDTYSGDPSPISN